MGAAVFGKLPAHGDFIARGLAPAERDEIDAWLAESLEDARSALGHAFDGAYDCAPPWRFGDAADGVAGALAPSVDAVGRRFPILVMRRRVPYDGLTAAAAACESLLFDALSGGWDADALVKAVHAIEPTTGDPWPDGPGWWTDGGENFPPAALPGRRPRAILRTVLTMECPQ